MDSPCSDLWELQYSGSAIEKQAGPPDCPTHDRFVRRKENRMIRTILTAIALMCASQAAFAQELTAEQRNACMGDFEKYCKGVAPGGGRIIACLAKESDKLTPACKKVLEAAERK